MPRGDRTGPEGFGPMTGRGFGYCAGNNRPGYAAGVPGGRFERVHGRGFTHGRGRGYGRVFYHSNYDPELAEKEELDYLKYTARSLENELEAVKKQINKLESEKNSE